MKKIFAILTAAMMTVMVVGMATTVFAAGAKLEDGTKQYNGKQLEIPLETKDGQIYGPLSFVKEFIGVSYTAMDKTIDFSGLLQGNTVTGTITDATRNTLTIKTTDGTILSFMTDKADRSGANGIVIGKSVTVYYNGEIKGTDTKDATVMKVTEASGSDSKVSPNTPVRVTGIIQDATMNTITIKTAEGKQLSFKTEDADKTKCNGLLIGSGVDIFYTGEIQETDTSLVTVVSLEQLQK